MFKYIYEDENGFTIYDKYFDYLDSIEEKLDTNLYILFSDINRYNLTSKHSFHDSWLKSLNITDTVTKGGKTNTKILIELVGSHHDRYFLLEYRGVLSYSFERPSKKIPINHYDLLYHEIRLNKKKELEHAILFDNDIKFFIIFKSLNFQEIKHEDYCGQP